MVTVKQLGFSRFADALFMISAYFATEASSIPPYIAMSVALFLSGFNKLYFYKSMTGKIRSGKIVIFGTHTKRAKRNIILTAILGPTLLITFTYVALYYLEDETSTWLFAGIFTTRLIEAVIPVFNWTIILEGNHLFTNTFGNKNLTLNSVTSVRKIARNKIELSTINRVVDTTFDEEELETLKTWLPNLR